MARACNRGHASLPLLTGLVLAALSAGGYACTGTDTCTSPETFVAFFPGANVSAIPLCTSGAEPSASTIAGLDGSFAQEFPGAAPLSSAGSAQCSVICSQATAPLPCCVSVWEPDTVLCPPACVPP